MKIFVSNESLITVGGVLIGFQTVTNSNRRGAIDTFSWQFSWWQSQDASGHELWLGNKSSSRSSCKQTNRGSPSETTFQWLRLWENSLNLPPLGPQTIPANPGSPVQDYSVYPTHHIWLIETTWTVNKHTKNPHKGILMLLFCLVYSQLNP